MNQLLATSYWLLASKASSKLPEIPDHTYANKIVVLPGLAGVGERKVRMS